MENNFGTEEVEEEGDAALSIISDHLLDENGFPSFFNPLSSEEEQVVIEQEEDESIKVPEEEEEESFASDFYRSGADWSSLLVENNNNKEKKLKQTNLFQLWGLKKPPPPDVSGSKCRVSSLPPFKKKKKKKNKEQLLMDSNTINPKEEEEEEEVPVPRYGRNKRNGSRPCPFYKKIPGTPFTVDAFRYGLIVGCSAYFLTHFHYDHYGGLSKGWSHGPIYCTPLTARLVRTCLSVNPSLLCPLELDTEYVISGTKVILLEANHCPGAALIYFCLKDGQCLLHTGDFRACKLMQSYPLLMNKRINQLYLDTTYCNPKYRFPPIEDVLAFVVKVTKIAFRKQPKTLVIVGAYSIGKERVYLAISEALGVKIHANASRRRILKSFDWPELSGRLCSDAKDTPLHVLPMSSLRHENLKQYFESNRGHYTSVLAFRPTGWTYSEASGSELDLIKPSIKGNITIYGVPYSEHSSFLELREFVQFLRPGKIIPTVNIGNAAQRDKMQGHFREWLKT